MRKYIPALLINTGILAAVFMIFIFIDVNINRAVKDTIRSKTAPAVKPALRCEKYIDWIPGFIMTGMS